MKTLHKSYQTVISHIDTDIDALRKSGNPADKVAVRRLQKRREWLIQRKNSLEERNRMALTGLNNRMEIYLSLCDDFWKEMHDRTYEDMMDRMLEAKNQVVKIFALSGFDAYYALFVTLKTLRSVLPLEQYEEHALALSALEDIKKTGMAQLTLYINH